MSVNSREEEKRGREARCRSKISLANLSDTHPIPDGDRRHGSIQKARGPHQAWRSLQFVVNLSAFLERNGQVAIYHNTSEHRHQKNDIQTAPEHSQYEEYHGCKGALLADENRYCERDAEDEVCYYDELAFKRRKLIGKKGQCPLQ